jgi:lysophospholipase L1-like esterase
MNSFPINNLARLGVAPESIGSFPGKESSAMGTLYFDTFSSLSNWTQSGSGTYAPSGSGLTLSGGSGVWTEYISLNQVCNSVEKFKLSCMFTELVAGSFALGIDSLQKNATLNRSFYGRFTAGSLFSAAIVSFADGTGTVATVYSNSSTSACAVNDVFLAEFERDHQVYTVRLYNLTKGTSVTTTYTQIAANMAVPNVTGNFSIHLTFNGGSQLISWFKAESLANKNVRAVFIGDSITQHSYQTDLYTDRYANRVFSGSNRVFEVHAGGNNGISNPLSAIDFIKSYKADYVFLMIGGNNVLGGLTTQALVDYVSLRNQIKPVSQVVHLLATPRTATDMTAFNDFLRSFTDDLVIDTFSVLRANINSTAIAAAYDNGDGTHPNNLGHAAIASKIRTEMPYLI